MSGRGSGGGRQRIEENHLLPDYKDQVRSRSVLAEGQAISPDDDGRNWNLLLTATNDANNNLAHRQNLQGYEESQHAQLSPTREDQRFDLARPMKSSQTAAALGVDSDDNNYLPEFKDQIREVHPPLRREGKASNRAVINPREQQQQPLPQFKDQVRDEPPNPSNKQRSAHALPFTPADARIENNNLLQAPVIHRANEPHSNRTPHEEERLPQFKDQARDDPPPARPNNGPDTRESPRASADAANFGNASPEFKDRRHDFHPRPSRPTPAATQRHDRAPRTTPAVATDDYLPNFKDQARDVRHRPSRPTPTASHRADASPDALVAACKEEPLPQFKDQVHGTMRQARDPPQSRTAAIEPESFEDLEQKAPPEFKDQVRDRNARGNQHVVDPVPLPTYKNQVNPDRQEQNKEASSASTRNDVALSPHLNNKAPVATEDQRQTGEGETLSTTVSTSGEARAEAPMIVFGSSMVQDYHHHASNDRVVEAQGILVGEIFDESPTVARDSEEAPERNKAARKNMVKKISFIVVALIVVVAAAVGGVCGAGKCSGAGHSVTDSKTVNPTTIAPTVSCEDGDYPKAFETTAELYKAVDEYIALFSSPSNQQETDRGSILCNVTFRYGPISQWDVTRLTDFKLVFHRNRDLYPNQDLLKPMPETIVLSEDIRAWNVSAATTMEGMFAGVEDFNPSFLQTWDTSRVTSMKSMNADFSLWNTAAVTDFSFMFVGNSAFNGTGLRNWTTTSAENLSGMFSGDSSLTEVDFSGWNVNQIVDASYVFNGCGSFVGDVSAWSFNAVKSLRSMFQDCSSFNGDLSLWGVSGVTDFSSMFQGASIFNGNLSLWDTSNAELMNSTFQDAAAFTGVGLSLWNVSSVRYMNSMFEQASSLSSVDLSTWQTRNVESMASMFKNAGAFIGSGLSSWDVSSVRDMSSMFEGAASVGSIDLSGWRTDRLEKTTSMFKGATLFNSDLPWKMSLVTDMFEMFYKASAFTGDVSFWDTSSCTNMGYLFAEATFFNGNLSYWDTSLVVTMALMFQSTSNFNGDVSTWNTSSVTSMNNMFEICSFNGDISRWDVRNVQSASYMFREASSFNVDLSSWELRNAMQIDHMFTGAVAFNQSLCAWGDTISKGRNDSGILLVQDIFQSTACPNTADPDTTNLAIGPWCHSCN